MRSGRAAFTMVKNESVFLPLWVKYYSQFFDGKDLFVLDHASDDGTIERLRERYRFNVTRLEYPVYNDFQWYTGTIMQAQRRLLERYDLVLFTEPDEIVCHPLGLGTYMDRFSKPCIHTFGREIHHDPAQEPAIDLDRPIIAQRRFWYIQHGFSKPLLGRVPIEWNRAGFHTAANCNEQDPELLLIHLHKIDFQLAYEKNRRVATYRWSEEADKNGWGWHNKALDEKFSQWYYGDSLCGGVIEAIPEDLRRNPPI